MWWGENRVKWKKPAFAGSQTQDTSGLSRQCSATEPQQPGNHQPSQSSIYWGLTRKFPPSGNNPCWVVSHSKCSDHHACSCLPHVGNKGIKQLYPPSLPHIKHLICMHTYTYMRGPLWYRTSVLHMSGYNMAHSSVHTWHRQWYTVWNKEYSPQNMTRDRYR